MHRIKDIEGVKPSLRGKKVILLDKNEGTTLIELAENAGRYKAGEKILALSYHIEEIE